MAIRAGFVSAIATLSLASAAFAQQPPAAAGTQSTPELPIADLTKANFFDVGFRGTLYGDDSDRARYQRYRDLPNGLTFHAFRFSKESSSRGLAIAADHVGYRDQQYTASLNQFGKLRASFTWNQTPLFFSEDTLALYSSPMAGVLRIDDPIQRGIETQTTTLSAVAGQALPFDMRLQRNVADLRASYQATPHVDLDVTVKHTTKNGSQPWAGTFGFSNAVEMAVPVETRTTELGAALEWANPRASARIGYDGSFVHNDTDTLIWDNPLRITDSPSSGPYQGRMSLWPDSTMNAGSALGTINLPARTRATGYVSIGSWSQDEALVPFTINTALPTISADRPTADAGALVTAMHYTLTSRPTDRVQFTARYRWYDFDNRTPVFHVGNTVSYDTSVSAFSPGGTSPYSINRKTFDGEVSFTPVAHTALRAGYTNERVGQTFRYVDSANENTVRFSADLTGWSWLTLRGVYEHTRRTGSGFDEQVLDDIGEQTSLRQFDISDRTADRFSAIVMWTPAASLSFNGQLMTGDDDRSDEGFGVLNGQTRSYSVGVDYVPRDAIAFGASYIFDRYGTLQKSRQANPGPEFDDPRRDWTTDAHERADTVSLAADLMKLWPRTDVRLGYDFSSGRSRFLYELAPDSTLTPVTQLPPVNNQLRRATVDMRHYVTKHTALGFMYWFDRYRVDDFANEPATLSSIVQPSFLMIGYTARPYTANTFVGRLTYLW